MPERIVRVARNPHMPPSVVGQIAPRAEVRYLLPSHRMKRTFGKQAQSTRLIPQHHQGPPSFAEDM
jgi:ribonuclease BN (tRNA processing enzyme)